MQREEDIFDIRASLKLVGPFSLRLGYAENQADITVTNDPSEVVFPWGQGGQYDRKVGTFDGGLLFKLDGLSLGVDYTTQDADNAVMRTDFLERDRMRVRGAWEPAKWFRIGATAEEVDTTNDEAGYGLDGKMKTYAGDLEVGPWEWLRLRVGAGRFEGDNSISYRQPQDWVDGRRRPTPRRGDSHGRRDHAQPQAGHDRGAPAQVRERGELPVRARAGAGPADFGSPSSSASRRSGTCDDYTEKNRCYGSGADYKANRYGLYLHIHP